MATMQGITGKVSGKMGSAVFRVRDGQQVITQYNPIVKNPSTDKQQAQRAKFKLMSQLAAVMSSGFGTLAVAKRKAKGGQPSQRNAFVELNFKLVETDTAPDGVIAKIPMEQLKLTSSFRFLPQVGAVAEEGENNVIVSMTDIPSEIESIRAVVVGYPSNDTASPAILAMQDIPVANGEISANVQLPMTLRANDKLTILSYGLIPTDTTPSSVDLSNIHTPDDEDFISAVQLNAMVSEGSILQTQTTGVNVTAV